MAVDGVYPDKNTISDGSYPIQTAYYAVIRLDEPKESNAYGLSAAIPYKDLGCDNMTLFQ